MQKRKVKLNILDIAIFAVIICSVLTLVFHDTIVEFFGKPEIKPLEIKAVTVDGNENIKNLFVVGSTVTFAPDNGNDQIQAVVTSATFDSDGKARFTFSCNGYERLGRFYTENGDKLSVNSEYYFNFGVNPVNCRLESVGKQSAD